MFRPFIVICYLSAATGALADPVPVTNDDLKRLVSGSIVEIDTPLGTTVPMRFGTDGLVSAEAGVLGPVLGSAKDRGRWWVDGDKLCTKWFRWFDAGVRCLTIAREGSRIHWRKIDDGETGTGTLVSLKAPQEKKPAVVAKADPPPPPSPPKPPVSKSEPESEKRGTRLAAPPREQTEEPSRAPEPQPTVVAHAEEAESKSDIELNGVPAMRFGGTGLLGTSALAAPASPASDTQSDAKPADVLPPQQRPVAKLPPKDVKTDVASSAASDRKVPAERQAAFQAKQAPPKRTPSTERRVATSSTSAVALYRVIGVADYDVLNVRRGPSERHVQIASIPPTGRQVEIIGRCRADWCPIRYGEIKGWVNSYYLAEDGARQATARQ